MMMTDSPFRTRKFTVAELKDELRIRRLPVSGRKEDLVARLEEHDGITAKKKGAPSSTSNHANGKTVVGRSRSPSRENGAKNAGSPRRTKDVGGPGVAEKIARSPKAEIKAKSSSTNTSTNTSTTRGDAARGRQVETSPRRGAGNGVVGRGSASRSPSVATKKRVDAIRAEYKETLDNFTWFRSPVLILSYSYKYIAYNTRHWIRDLFKQHSVAVFSGTFAVLSLTAACYLDSPVQSQAIAVSDRFMWYFYWIILGILSSVGFGSGLQTFVLFLAPHIREVSRVATECGNYNFLTHGPKEFICNEVTHKLSGEITEVNAFGIYSMVYVECLLWGLGTAIGELPPYFMARASAKSGDGKTPEIEMLESIKGMDKSELRLFERMQLGLFYLVEKFGFFGILLCASIPNPLFDLAGIICGRFGISFYTFFGATFIGKVLIKSNIQSFFIILFTSKETEMMIRNFFQSSPRLYTTVDYIFKYIDKKRSASSANDSTGTLLKLVLGKAWNITVGVLLVLFCASAIKTFAELRLKLEFERRETRAMSRKTK